MAETTLYVSNHLLLVQTGQLKISNSQIHRLLVSVVMLSNLGLALPHLNREEAVSETRKSILHVHLGHQGAPITENRTC